MFVLVTGAAGYVGSHIIWELIRQSIPVVALDNLSRGSLSNFDHLSGASVPMYREDIRSVDALVKIMKDHQVTACIHCAAFKSAPESLLTPLDYYDVNVLGTISLLRACEKASVHQIVYSSSAAVYGNAPSPIREEAPYAPLTPYGWSKVMAERILKDTATARKRLGVLSLRYFNPLGALENLEDLSQEGNIMTHLLNAAHTKVPLTVFGKDYATVDGTPTRDFIHVEDLAKAHVLALKHLSVGGAWKGYDDINLGMGHEISILELLTTFERVNQVSVPYRLGPRRLGDITQSYADIQKSHSLLNWRPSRTLDDMCRDAWQTFLKKNISLGSNVPGGIAFNVDCDRDI